MNVSFSSMRLSLFQRRTVKFGIGKLEKNFTPRIHLASGLFSLKPSTMLKTMIAANNGEKKALLEGHLQYYKNL